MVTREEALERCKAARFAVQAAERALKIARLEQKIADAWLVALLTDGTLPEYAVRAQERLAATAAADDALREKRNKERDALAPEPPS